MQYNVLTTSQYMSNTTSGNKSLLFGQLAELVEYGDSPVVSLNPSDVLVVDFDLGTRIHLDKLYYKFYSSASQNVVANSIVFSYKNEFAGTSYTPLTTYIDTVSGIYYTSLSGSILAPRQIRVTHTLSSTSGTLYGFSAFTSEDIVDFGTSGSSTETGIEVIENGSSVITPIAIFNSGVHEADAILSIDPTYTDLDEIVAVGLTEEGPWSYPRAKDIVVADASSFDYGTYSNTSLSTSSTLKVSRFKDGNNVNTFMDNPGIYYSKIFHGDLTQMSLSIDNLSSSGLVAVDSTDTIETIEVRSSNEEPIPYSFLRYPIYSVNSNDIYFYLRTLFTKDLSVAYDGNSFYTFYIGSGNMDDYEAVISKNSDRTVGWITSYSTNSGPYTKFFLYNVISSTYYTAVLATHNTASVTINNNVYSTKITNSGGMWIYFYCQSYNSGDFVNQTGYYLCYFNSSLSNIFKQYDTTKKFDYMDVDFYTSNLWITRRSNKAIYKMDTTGATLLSFERSDQGITDNLGPLFVLENGNGIWFSNGPDLHKLNDSGTEILDTIEDIVDSNILYMAMDLADSNRMWLVWGSKIGLFNIAGTDKGEMIFYVALSNIVAIDATYYGCWAKVVNLTSPDSDSYQFISKANKKVDQTYNPAGVSKPAVKELPYFDSTYTDLMSTLPTNTWKTLEWSKINPATYLFSEEKYYQFKLTLRIKKASELYSGESSFIKTDEFTQTSARPRDVLWGSWRAKETGDGLSRVYVSTVSGTVVLTPQWGGSENAYINTVDRMLVAKNSNKIIDIRIHYKIADGNVYPSGTGRDEYLYLNCYSLKADSAGAVSRVYLRMYPSLTNSLLASYNTYNDVTRTLTLSSPSLAYEGILRLYIVNENNSTVYDTMYGYVYYNNNWYNVTGNSSYINAYYWVSIDSDKNSSQMQITKFEVVSGDCYYYTDCPEIEAIGVKQPVVLNNISPNSYKNAYLKTQVTDGLSLPSTADINLKARWEVPVS